MAWTRGALFGLGAGGVFSYVMVGCGKLPAKLGALGIANAVCVVAALWFILSRAGDAGSVALAFVYFASALVFFLAGIVVSIAISEAIERVDRAYFFDLAGAAARAAPSQRNGPSPKRLRDKQRRWLGS